MAYRELELTLHSARDLKNVNLFTRMDVYAVASLSGDPITRQCTPTDTSGGRNPSWDATLRFNVPPTADEAGTAYVHVLLRSERALGDRDIGEVFVPLADILADGGTGAPRVAGYQVHTVHRGEPRGVLNVSYRLGPVVAPVDDGKKKPSEPEVVMAWPVAPTQTYWNQQQPQYYGYGSLPQEAYKNQQTPAKPPPQQPSKPQPPAPQQQPYPYQNSHNTLPRQPSSKPQTPAAPQQQPYPYQNSHNTLPRQPSSKPPQTPASQQPNHPPHGGGHAPPPRRESYPSPANTGHGNGHGTPTQVYVCPDIHVTVSSTSTPPATPRSHTNTNTISAKPDGLKPKPSYTPPAHQPNVSPVKTDHHSWPRPSPQHTQTWPNASPNKPTQQDTNKVGSGRPAADHSAAAAALKPQDSTKISSGNIGGARKTQAAGDYGRAESRPTREGYANSGNSSMPGGGKAQYQSGAGQQYERVPSMPTAAAR